MIIQFARIFSSSIYHDSPQWVAAVKMMEQWDDEKCLAHLDIIKENSGYVSLTPAVYKELARLMAAKDVAGFLALFDALRYPVFSALLINLFLQDVGFLEELIKQLPNQAVLRPKMTMALIRDRWMKLRANALKQDVVNGEPVEKAIGKPIDGGMETVLVDDLQGILKVLGPEEMFQWAIELRRNRTMGAMVQYQSDVESVTFNRLRFFVLNTLPSLVDLNAMEIDSQHLPYILYMLCAYIHQEPTNTARMDVLLKSMFNYLQSNSSPTCSNEELYRLLVPAAKAYALCRHQDSKEILSMIDSRRVNAEGWRMESHHKRLVDDDIDTDIITWPKHYMTREQQEMIAYRLAWHLLGEDRHFANDEDKESYYDALISRMLIKVRSMDGNEFRVDSYGIHDVVRLAYDVTVNAMPSGEERFVSCLMASVDALFDVFMFLDDGNIQLGPCHKQELKKRFDADWAGERKIYEILGLYSKVQLDEVEKGIKGLM